MGYKVPDWKKSIDQNTFEVEIGRKTYKVPKTEWLTGNQAKVLALVETNDAMYDAIDQICPGLGSAFRDVPRKHFDEFLEAWHDESSVTPGESEASTGS